MIMVNNNSLPQKSVNVVIIGESEEIVDSASNKQISRYPILFVDVNLGDERVERLTVFEGRLIIKLHLNHFR